MDNGFVTHPPVRKASLELDFRTERTVAFPALMNCVLIVDSSESDSFLLSQLIQVMGHSVEVVTSVREAQSRVVSYVPHVVICSGHSALEPEAPHFLAAWRAVKNSRCVLVLHAEGPTLPAANAFPPLDFDFRLAKPVDIIELQGLIGDHGCLNRLRRNIRP